MNTQSATLTGQALELVLTEKMSQAAEDWESTWRGLVDLEVAQPGCDYTITLRNHSQLAREARLALEAKVVYG
jgi:hypothetical protein